MGHRGEDHQAGMIMVRGEEGVMEVQGEAEAGARMGKSGVLGGYAIEPRAQLSVAQDARHVLG